MNYKYGALYVRKDSIYKDDPDFDCYDKERDALTYSKNYPVICHPPCRSWTTLQSLSFRNNQNPEVERLKEMYLALHALRMVYTHGGILEHPKGSRLWKIMSHPRATIININQRDFGHKVSKPTTLLIYPQVQLPTYPLPNYTQTDFTIETLSTKQRELTPITFKKYLKEILEKVTAHH